MKHFARAAHRLFRTRAAMIRVRRKQPHAIPMFRSALPPRRPFEKGILSLPGRKSGWYGKAVLKPCRLGGLGHGSVPIRAHSAKFATKESLRGVKFPFPVLLCDIGGTNARFALVPAPGAPLEAGPHLKTREFCRPRRRSRGGLRRTRDKATVVDRLRRRPGQRARRQDDQRGLDDRRRRGRGKGGARSRPAPQ